MKGISPHFPHPAPYHPLLYPSLWPLDMVHDSDSAASLLLSSFTHSSQVVYFSDSPLYFYDYIPVIAFLSL